ncbi:MAG TPA: hypothetical protein VJS66_01185 [Burkholderiales bacterium]|nr:hypothetical protein [Burkholderiales bacterium]
MEISKRLWVRWSLALFVFVCGTAVQAIELRVKKNADCTSGATCCLRLAVAAANTPGTTSAQNSCVPAGQTSTGNGDVIQLGDTNAKALTVTLGPIDISRTMTIRGNLNGANPNNSTVKITGSGSSVFRIPYGLASGIVATFEYLRITGATDLSAYGAAVSAPYRPTSGHHKVSMDTVQLDNCTAWSGGAVYVDGILAIDGDQASGSSSSSIHDNKAAYGGAIYHTHTEEGYDGESDIAIRVNNTTFTKNYADQNFGSGNGGAIYIASARARISNSVFGGGSGLGNKAGCGATCTGTGRGGAIYTDAFGSTLFTHLINTTFSYNVASSGDVEQGGGGAIFANTDLNLSSINTFSNNTCSRVAGGTYSCRGGALWNRLNGYISIFDIASFTNNSATGTGSRGGAVYAVSEDSNTTSNAAFSNNTAANSCNLDAPADAPNGYCGYPAGNGTLCPGNLMVNCQDNCNGPIANFCPPP